MIDNDDGEVGMTIIVERHVKENVVPTVHIEGDRARKHLVGLGNGNPVRFTVEDLFSGVHHINVQITGLLIRGIEESHAHDTACLANLVGSINLLRQ